MSKKSALILHNPKAGEGEWSANELMNVVNEAGFECSYSSTKEDDWTADMAADKDLLVVAGGDGTVRKVLSEFLNASIPIGLIPLGTANNIANTLGIKGSPAEIAARWEHGSLKRYDVGRIYNLREGDFFLEGFGFGVFPRLMKEMKKKKKELPDAPDENLKVALTVLHDIILESKARYCKINIDGADHSGKFLLAEVMNIQSIGPNLNLAPFADPADGSFEVILISERQREEFARYVHNKIHGVDQPPIFNILKGKNLEIFWEGKLLHVDDQIVQLKASREIKIKIQEGVLQFLVPSNGLSASGMLKTGTTG